MFKKKIMHKKCINCGTPLPFLKRYYHPVKGKPYLVCSHCYDTLTKSLQNYQHFILENLNEHHTLKTTTDYLPHN